MTPKAKHRLTPLQLSERDQLGRAISEAFRVVGDSVGSHVRWLSHFAERDLAAPGALESAPHEIMAFTGKALPRGFGIIGTKGDSGMAYPDRKDVPEIQNELRKCLRVFSTGDLAGHYWSPETARIRYGVQWDATQGLQSVFAEGTPLARFVLALFTLLANNRERVRLCVAPKCQRLFYAERPVQKYCSRRCLNRAMTTKFRSRRPPGAMATARSEQRQEQKKSRRAAAAGIPVDRVATIKKPRR